MIDEHVHFRTPGMIHKGDMSTESRAALAGGVTSVIDMPNVIPQTTTNVLLEEKLLLAKKTMYCNYAFHLAGTDTNLDEIYKIDKQNVAAIKLFLGSSTGNMLIQDEQVLDKIFSIECLPVLIHAENENIIRKNTELYRQRFGETMPISKHSNIRSEEACYTASAAAVQRAKRLGTRLHVLHISTQKELSLFSTDNKNITAEVCPSYLFFDNNDYDKYGTLIKCNPAIKTEKDKLALQNALNNGVILTVGSDHAPHTWEEKQHGYFQAPSGMPMVQHSLQILLELVYQKQLTLERLVDSFAHQIAELFKIHKRGYLREGYFADMVLVDLSVCEEVKKENIFYKGFYFFASCLDEYDIYIFYDSLTGKKPANSNILYCNKDTTIEEINTFIFKAIFCKINSLFMIVIPEYLNNTQKSYLINILNKKAQKEGKLMISCLIIFFSIKDSEFHQSILKLNKSNDFVINLLMMEY